MHSTVTTFLFWALCFVAPVFGAGPPDPGGPTNTFLDSWSFSDTNEFSSDLAYKSASYSTNLLTSDLGDGPALVVDGSDPTWLQFNIYEASGATNLSLTDGSVLLWFAPNWTGTNADGTGPGTWGRLLEVGNYTADASFGWWSLYFNGEGTRIYFGAQSNDGSQVTYLSAPIHWDTTNCWHFLVLTYSSTNSALYIDGELATNGLPVTVWPDWGVQANGFYIGSDNSGTAQCKGMLDEMSTFANPVDAGFAIESYWYGIAPYYLNPDNKANLASAPSYPTSGATFQAIAGAGFLQLSGTATPCITNGRVWITNVVATVLANGTMNLAFSVEGGADGLPYDVFATAGIQYPITNATWSWMGQAFHCNRYLLTNMPPVSAFLILGTPQDSDSDSLTDSYERLISKTDPLKADTSGDGMLDGWKVLWGLSPQLNNVLQAGQRANYGYKATGFVDYLTGLRQETVGTDEEGNVNSDL